MEVDQFTAPRFLATEKWKEYVRANKVHKNPIYRDLAKLYLEIKSGKKVIDISKVIPAGGVHDNYHPKLAIAMAKTKTVTCIYTEEGHISFFNGSSTWKTYRRDIVLESAMPRVPVEKFGAKAWRREFLLQAPVPMIPAKHLPAKITDQHYILWEVDEWKMIPPTDPFLLKRLTRTHFAVLAAWDLTPLEKSVMASYL